jgi:hypothetical protein
MTTKSITLSKETLEILKTAFAVNQNLLIREDSNLIWSMSVGKNVVLKTEVAEIFPVEFPVYNLGELLASLTLFKTPELTFSDKHVLITEAGQKKGTKLKYVASAKELLVYPSKTNPEPAWDAEFNLSVDALSQIVKASGVLNAPDIQIVGSDDGITINVCDKKNKDANVLSIPVVDVPQANSFTVDLRVENLKLIPGDYQVQLSFKGLVKFTSARMALFVSMETSSKL